MFRFALDENYPTPLIAAVGDYFEGVELVSVREIDPRLQSMDDPDLLLALHHDPGRWAGLITTDTGILRQPRSLDIIRQTQLALVVARSAGHDPLVATGLVLANLPAICARLQESPGGVFELVKQRVVQGKPAELFAELAKRSGSSPTSFRQQHGLSSADIARDPLSRRR
jgi:hypothetical protein